ncbi:hypothetical protein [Cupriavidus necator]|uniref:hypothetical protein n=1 Tax=Cupriavidus necator TaxID=106590 RepID=UPI0009933F0F|nr:hypothetical protein [Cupriavidus necator]
MTFKYEAYGQGAAVDPEQNIRITLAPFRDLDVDNLVFVFKDDQMEFEFDTVEFHEVRPKMFRGSLVEQKCPVLTCIVEPSIRRAMIAAMKGRPLEEGFYEEKRKAIEEAMFVLTMKGDVFRSLAPDYRVKFVQSIAEARRHRVLLSWNRR